MSDVMNFPDTWEEFEEIYGITDKERIYTNGARLIPSFRVEQWLEHIEPKVGRWIEKDGMWCDDPTFRCSVCGEEYELLEGTPIDNGMNYCPNCGSRMFERRTDEID